VPVSISHVPWSAVFGNDRPVEVEIGPGSGEVLLAGAAAAPAVNFFAIERRSGAATAVAHRAHARGLRNVRVLAADARAVIEHLIGDASVAAYHVYFPDPWPKTRHRDRRLVTDGVAHQLLRTLVPGGALHLATDVQQLLEAFATALVRAGLARLAGSIPPAGRPVTVYECRYAGAGTHYARFVRPRPDGTGAPAPVAGDF